MTNVEKLEGTMRRLRRERERTRKLMAQAQFDQDAAENAEELADDLRTPVVNFSMGEKKLGARYYDKFMQFFDDIEMIAQAEQTDSEEKLANMRMDMEELNGELLATSDKLQTAKRRANVRKKLKGKAAYAA